MKSSLNMLWVLCVCVSAQAGIYSDDMARCLVSSSSAQDKTDLVKWVFINAALHPDVAPLFKFDAAVKEEQDRKMAAILEKLVTESCRKQSIDALRYEGRGAFEQSFGTLGQVAMSELMGNKTVAEGFGSFVKYMDKAKFDALGTADGAQSK